MKRLSLLLVLFLLVLTGGFSLELWINDEFSRFFTQEELKDYAIKDDRNGTYSLLLARIIPLFEDLYQIEAYGGRNSIALEEPSNILDSLYLVFTKESSYLAGNENRLEKPERIEIYGKLSNEKELILLYHESDHFTRDRMEMFCRYHGIDFIALPSANPAKELANRIMQQKQLPHIVVYDETDLPLIDHLINEKHDYSFSVTSLFSRVRTIKRPMKLDQILAESSHTYSWNAYDYPVLRLFQEYYQNRNHSEEEALVNGLILQRSLYEMGLLDISKSPSERNVDFFLENSLKIEMSRVTNYHDFVKPLFTYRCFSVPKDKKETVMTDRAVSFLLSENTQKLIGREINGMYPAVNSNEYTIPSDPCALLINKYESDHVRINYSKELLSSVPYWETLSRLALNSSYSLDKLKAMTLRQQPKDFLP